jgi:ABC-type hemin transport system substrate-binding protein
LNVLLTRSYLFWSEPDAHTEPDLVLTFSDLQAEIVAALIRAGVAVHAFNQRTVAGILDMIRTLGALVGAAQRADARARILGMSAEMNVETRGFSFRACGGRTV